MAEEQKEEAQEKGGKPIVLILIVALVAVGAGLGGGFVLFGKAPAEAPPAGEEAAAEEEEAAAETDDSVESYTQRLLQLEPIVANIEGDGYTRLLKVKVAFECDSPASRDEAEARLPQIQDAVLTLVSSKKLADVVDFEGKALLKDDLRDRVNHFLTGGKVKSVLITEFVVQ